MIWTESTITGTPLDNAKAAFGVYVWGNGLDASMNIPRRPLPPDVWHTIDLNDDLSQIVWPVELPADTKAIVLAGVCGTQGAPGIYCSVIQTFRAIGSSAAEYQIAAVSSVPGGAFRQNSTVVVPLRDRKFEFQWHASEPNAQELYQQFTIQQYMRGGDPLPPAPESPTLVASVSGAQIIGAVSNSPGNRLDWVGLYRVGQSGDSDWKYLNNTQTPPADPMTDATVAFMPLPGSYRLMLFANDGWQVLAESAVVQLP
jgi:hypothetical protein